jgi:APA family basic amino acid/polyamine antiporter
VLLAMSRDRLLPPALETVSPAGTPTVAHWATIGVVCGFILSGTFETVLALCAFLYVVGYLLSFLSVFALRRREPETPRPFRVPGFPVTTGIVVAGSAAFLVAAAILDWGNSWKSTLLLGLSWPVYRWTLRRRLLSP